MAAHLLAVWLLCAVVVAADIDHTISYNACEAGATFNASVCTFYTQIYYDGAYTEGNVDDVMVITLVGGDDTPTREGNDATCAVKESCTATTPTTVTVKSIGTNVVEYTLQDMGFKIPWQYYLTAQYTPSPPPAEGSVTVKSNVRNLDEQSVPAGTALFGDAGSFCVSQENYTESSGPYATHPGPVFPPYSSQLKLLPSNTAFTAACATNSCPRTTQVISHVNTKVEYFQCSELTDTAGTILSSYYVQEIVPFTNDDAAGNVGSCSIYAIRDPTVVTQMEVTVSSSLGNVTTEYAVTNQDTVRVPIGPGGAELAVTGLGTAGFSSPDNNTYIIPDHALLIECTPYTGGRSNVSLPTSCSAADGYSSTNYIFYVPPHYTNGYNIGNGYGAPADAIVDNILSSGSECYVYSSSMKGTPGYPRSGARLYDGSPSSPGCAIQSTTVPQFDAQRVCYDSVSPATMYEAQANDINQWFLPGTYHDDVMYSVDWDNEETGHILRQEFPSDTASTPPNYRFSMLLEVTDALMAYLVPGGSTAVVQASNTTCVYSATKTKEGQYKLVVCNGGGITNDPTKYVYNISTWCDPGLNVTMFSTLSTGPLAPGDCQGIVYPLAVDSSEFATEPNPPMGNDTDTGTRTVPPYCHSVITTFGADDSDDPVLEDIICINIPSTGGGGSFPYFVIGIIAGIFLLLIFIMYILCRYIPENDGKKKPTDKKKKQ